MSTTSATPQTTASATAVPAQASTVPPSPQKTGAKPSLNLILDAGALATWKDTGNDIAPLFGTGAAVGVGAQWFPGRQSRWFLQLTGGGRWIMHWTKEDSEEFKKG